MAKTKSKVREFVLDKAEAPKPKERLVVTGSKPIWLGRTKFVHGDKIPENLEGAVTPFMLQCGAVSKVSS